MEQTHDQFLACHPVPDQHSVQRHPKVHPHDVLHDLHYAPVLRAKGTRAQDGHLRRRVRRDRARAEFPKEGANVRAGSGAARVSTGSSGKAMLEEDNQVLRGIECKIPDTHAEIIDDQPRLVVGVARQPRDDQPARRAKLLECLDEQPTHQLIRVAVPR